MAQENKSKVSILTNGIIKENPVLRLAPHRRRKRPEGWQCRRSMGSGWISSVS